MRTRTTWEGMGGGPGSGLPRVIKILLIVNVGLFLLDFILERASSFSLRYYFALVEEPIFQRFQVWRLVTYMFLHDNRLIFHILFNMLMLWMFGVPVVDVMGERKFLSFYLSSGVFAALCTLLFYAIFRDATPVIGASGAIFGLMVAFAHYFPRQQILIFFLFPVEARYAMLIFGGIEFLMLWSQDGVAHITHLGGALYALLHFRFGGHVQELAEGWQDKRLERKEREQKKAEQKLDKAMLDIDPILKKISSQGIGSLTREEKERLDQVSEIKRRQKGKIINWEDYRKS